MIDQHVLSYSHELKKLGIKHKILEHPVLKEIDDVQKYLGFGIDESLATLIMKTEKGYIALIKRGHEKLDSKKIKKVLHVNNLRIATNDEFVKLTNVVPGAAHVLHPVTKTLIDKHIFQKQELNGGTGSLTATFTYLTEDLTKIPNSIVCEITHNNTDTNNEQNKVQRVFSGIRATGRLHLGNYLGAVKGMFAIQESGMYETVFCVVDVHTITTPYDVELLKKNKKEIVLDYLASGLDPQKSMIVYQSDVPEHTELSFYFSSIMSIARMQHLPTFKDKVKQHPNNVTMALLNYPILMAADILIYKASLVPVGIDQEPHLEIAREVARKMNEKYGMDFPQPVRFATKGEYVPSLKGEGKMSKSVEGSYINLTDSKDTILKKVRSIPTATTAGGTMSPGVQTLFKYAELYIPQNIAEFQKQYDEGSLKFVELKDEIANAIYQELEPFQKKRQELERQPEYIESVLKKSSEKARAIAQKTVAEVKEKMGLS